MTMTSWAKQSKQVEAPDEKHRLILDNIPSLIAYWDRDERCQYANSAYFDWFGYAPEQLLGKSMIELLGEKLYELNRCYIKKALQGERQVFDRELIHRQSGEKRYTKAYYIPDLQDGQVRGFYVLVNDVTELKTLELRAKEESENAKEASRAKSDFLARMSHEIRTPMNGVLGVSSLLLETQLTGEQKELVETIQRSGEALLDVINDILDFSKIEAGKIELEETEFDLNFLLETSLESVESLAKRKGLALSLQAPRFEHLVLGDVARIRQVLTNLIGNAIKFTLQGNVRVEVRLGKISRGRSRVLFRIIDTGIGIDPSALPRLFSAFSQADHSITRKFGGTGLGLSICRLLVERMQGKIGVRSRAGGGSTFWFEIPLKRSPRPIQDESKRATQQVFPSFDPSTRVLVVEDIVTNQKVVLAMLKKLGVQATAVANGLEALQQLELAEYDLVLMDCQMPELDGYEATRLIRADTGKIQSDVIVIALTANAFREDEARCIECGMNDFLTKPIRIGELARKLDFWLNPSKPGSNS